MVLTQRLQFTWTPSFQRALKSNFWHYKPMNLLKVLFSSLSASEISNASKVKLVPNAGLLFMASFPHPGPGIFQCLSYRFTWHLKRFLENICPDFLVVLSGKIGRKQIVGHCMPETEVSPLYFLNLKSLNHVLWCHLFLKDFTYFMKSISSPHTHNSTQSNPLPQWSTKKKV